MCEQEIRLYASHCQFYVQDSDPRGDTGDSSFWNKESSDNRLAVSEDILGIGTGSYAFINSEEVDVVRTTW